MGVSKRVINLIRVGVINFACKLVLKMNGMHTAEQQKNAGKYDKMRENVTDRSDVSIYAARAVTARTLPRHHDQAHETHQCEKN